MKDYLGDFLAEPEVAEIPSLGTEIERASFVRSDQGVREEIEKSGELDGPKCLERERERVRSRSPEAKRTEEPALSPLDKTARTTDRICADCGRSLAVLVEMKPGLDEQPWWLCRACLYPNEGADPCPKKNSPSPSRTRKQLDL